ncbi:carbohydrate ABC transporter permease [Glycomyces salinus]|uniref:carbohydrate ABC transporter permease n=1 Tax=Glycomyces salinus TaxID=980294 RepID=UPI0018EAD023|nr:sugar ABC transporter permease [Glycomyces salinus]
MTSTATADPREEPGRAGPQRPRPARAPGRLRRTRFRDPAAALLLLLPALVIFTLFKFIPMGRAVQMSLFEVRPYLGDRWVGMDNYRHVLTDPDFLDAMWHTAVIAVTQTAGAMLLGLAIALLLEGTARHLWLVRTAVFLPTIVTMAVVAEVWRVLYYPAPDGVVNSVLAWIGLGPSQFLNSADTSLSSVIAVGIWRHAPYDMMIILAGLAGVDRTLYEAASADGANTWQRLRHVTLPALRPVFIILLTLAAIRGMRVFTEIFLLTNGGPNGSTEVLMTLIYKLGLERNELGIAAAGSVVLLAVTVVLTLAVQAVRARRRA